MLLAVIYKPGIVATTKISIKDESKANYGAPNTLDFQV